MMPSAALCNARLIFVNADVLAIGQYVSMPASAPHPGACSAFGQDEPCTLSQSHEADLALCSDLERLADQLPNLPPAAELRRLTERLERASRRWQRQDEVRMVENCDAARLSRQIDSVHAEDVVEALWSQWQSRRGGNVDRLAYMLRSLFDGRRRAVALERLWLGCNCCHSSLKD